MFKKLKRKAQSIKRRKLKRVRSKAPGFLKKVTIIPTMAVQIVNSATFKTLFSQILFLTENSTSEFAMKEARLAKGQGRRKTEAM
jgi:hypothetical protein